MGVEEVSSSGNCICHHFIFISILFFVISRGCFLRGPLARLLDLTPLDASSICCIFKLKQWLNVRSFKQATLYFLKTIIRDINSNQRG